MPDRFCSQCGAALVPDASFCAECGRPLAGPRGVPLLQLPLGRYAPIFVVGILLLITGGAVIAGRSNPTIPPSVPGRGPGGGSSANLPSGHPPIELPEDTRRTIEDMRRQAEAAPDDTALWQRLAGVQYRAGQLAPTYLAQAEASYQHILDREPKNLEALRALGNLAFDREQPARAVEYYQRYLEQKPDDLNVQTDMATMHLAQGQTDTAIEHYQKVLEQKSDFFQAHFNLGIAYRAKGDLDKAVEALRTAKGLASDDRARAQIDELMAQVTGTPLGPPAQPAGGPAPAAGNPFRTAVESVFRTHPMLGTRLDRVDWSNDTTARVLIRDFPMSAMPDEIRQLFTDRVRSQLKEKKDTNGVTGPVTIELVDANTQAVMETIAE